jgi:hypothetical protein
MIGDSFAPYFPILPTPVKIHVRCDLRFYLTVTSPSLLACFGFQVRVRVNDVKIGFSIGLLFMYCMRAVMIE